MADYAEISRAEAIAVGWMLLDIASRDDGSADGYNPQFVAQAVGLRVDKVESIADAMEDLGITRERKFPGFVRRYPEKPGSSTERVRAYRERQRALKEGAVQ